MSFRLEKNLSLNSLEVRNLNALNGLQVPSVPDQSVVEPGPPGSQIYNFTTNIFYISDGTAWVPVGNVAMGQDLATTLGIGNNSGGVDIDMSGASEMVFGQTRVRNTGVSSTSGLYQITIGDGQESIILNANGHTLEVDNNFGQWRYDANNRINIDSGSVDITGSELNLVSAGDINLRGVNHAPTVAPTNGQLLAALGTDDTIWVDPAAAVSQSLEDVMNVNNATPAGVDIDVSTGSEIAFVESDHRISIDGGAGGNLLIAAPATNNAGIELRTVAVNGDIDLVASSDISANAPASITIQQGASNQVRLNAGDISLTPSAGSDVLIETERSDFDIGLVATGVTVSPITRNVTHGLVKMSLPAGSGNITFPNSRVANVSSVFIQHNVGNPGQIDMYFSVGVAAGQWVLTWVNTSGGTIGPFDMSFFVVVGA